MAITHTIIRGKAYRFRIALPGIRPITKSFAFKKYGNPKAAETAGKKWANLNIGTEQKKSRKVSHAALNKTFMDAADLFCQIKMGFRLDGMMPKEAFTVFRDGKAARDTPHLGPNKCTPGEKPSIGKNACGPAGQLEWWINWFDGKAIDRITEDDVADGIDFLDDGTRSPASLNRYISNVKTAFNVVINGDHGRQRFVEVNPVKIKKKAENNVRTVELTPEQAERLLPNCQKSAWKDLYLVVMIGIACGARQGNIMGLRWSRLDLKSGRVDIPGDEMKNGKRWATWIKGEALELLQERDRKLKSAKVQNLFNPDFVFPSPKSNGHVMFESKIRDKWNLALKQSGIERARDPNDRANTGFRFHDLRRTFGKRMSRKGASTLKMKAMLGVRTDSIIDTYAALNIDDVEDMYL